jgi:selenide,water dikinase
MPNDESLKLTALSSCAGCASKINQQHLAHILDHLPVKRSADLLVGGGDDAGVYQIDRRRALVQTTDFFTPIVDDPFAYGQIAATNALSDVYAMGGRPLTALSLVAMPIDVVSLGIVRCILRGGAAKIKEAGCVLLGGHSIRNTEPVYGFAVTGTVSPKHVMTNSNAGPGDVLILTKPLGTGIITTAIKKGLASPSLGRKAIRTMTHLNTVGADLAEAGLVRAAVDVTGFGLLGHLRLICRGSQVGADIVAHKVPAVDPQVFDLISAGCVPGGSRDNLEYANQFTEWGVTTDVQKTFLTDAQTSGGLLLCVPEKRLQITLKRLEGRTLSAAPIGRIVRSQEPKIRVLA